MWGGRMTSYVAVANKKNVSCQINCTFTKSLAVLQSTIQQNGKTESSSTYCEPRLLTIDCFVFWSCHPSYTDKILLQPTVWASNGCQSEM